jgi:ribosome-associated protein
MDDLRVTDDLSIPADELDWTFLPSGGPGGQHANRSSSKVVLRFDVASSRAVDEETKRRLLDRLADPVLSLTVDDSRSQWRNRQIAKRRLRDRLQAALAPEAPRRRPTKPSRRVRQRRLDAKRARSQTKALRKPPNPGD